MPSTFTILAKRVFPNFNMRLRIRQIAGLPLDALDALTGKKDPLIPPRGLWFIGGGRRYREIAEETIGRMIAEGLTPQDRILGMGCGIGFTAAHLTKFVTQGSYEGFDVIRLAIDWASSNISKLHPNFRFQHADLFSQHYNPRGHIKSEEFAFPYEPDSFNFEFGLSLFTHLLPLSAEHYLQQMARTLKPGGTAFVTAFLINPESEALIQAGKSSLALSAHGNCWVLDAAFPETAVGLMESDFRRWSESAGLQLKRIDRGAWCGRTQFVGGHDHVILQKA
ncbi:MAG TPA: class I SAM-dependent methyltransferase [Candidatus Saccharimonadales bacterium]|jgi:SAM-dependent methyltransferase|nr:class I SAM-dependent methyltransferase [Candidatus Saccharimonadales bacterium]